MKKRMVSKALAIILIGALLLSGCSKEKTEEGQKETVNNNTSSNTSETSETNETQKEIKLTMTIFGSENDQAIYRQRLDAAEEANPGIKVELNYIPEEYDQKLLTMLATGTSAPDIMQLSENIHSYSDKGQLEPMGSYVNEVGLNLDERFGTAHQVYNYNGELYALPDRGGAMLLYYNKDLFDQAGVTYPTKDWTWDDFLNAAQQLTKKNGEVTEVYGFAAGDWWPWWMSFMYQNGGRILDENNNVVVNSPENVEALTFYNDLVYKYKVAPSPIDYANLGTTSPDPLFAQGKVAMELTGFWNIGSLNSVPEINWDIAPVWGQKENATTSFGSGLAIASVSKNKGAAFKIINYLTDYEGQMPIVTQNQDAPANNALLESNDFKNAKFAENQINLSAFAQSSDMIMNIPLGPWWNELTTVCGNHLSELFLNEKDAATVLEELEDDLETVMSNYK